MNELTLTRAKIAETIHNEIGLSRTESADLVEAIIDEIIGALEQEGLVKISSFGRFHVRNKRARVGRNPKTKKTANISARRVVGFRPSIMLKERINDAFLKERF